MTTAAGTPTEQKLDMLQADLVKTAGELKEAFDKRDAEIKSLGQAREESAAEVKRLFDQFEALKTSSEEERETLSKEQAKLRKEYDEFVAMKSRPGSGGGDEAKSFGAMFAESEAKKMYLGNGVPNINMPIKGSLMARYSKTLLDTGQIYPAAQRDPIIAAPQRMLRMRDLLPTNSTSTPNGEYFEQTGFNAGTTQAVTSIAHVAGLATITTTAAHGWGSIGETVWVTLAGANEDDYVGSFRMKIATATTATFAVDSGADSPATGTITAYKQFAAGAAAPVSEGSAKPEARLQLALRAWRAEFIAHHLPATRQVLTDNPQLQAFIDNQLLYGLDHAFDRELLYGTGSAPSSQGILTHEKIQTYAWSDGPLTTDTQIDALRRAMTRALIAEYPVTGLVIHPFDWESIELMKGDDDHYLAISSIDNAGITRFFRVPAVTTSAIAAGTALVGAFAQGGQIWDLEEGNIRIAEQHGTQFTENKVTILAEMRAGVAWYRPEAFVKVTLDSAPSG